MNIKPLPKTPRLPTSITDNGADFVRVLYGLFTDILSTTNSLVDLANNDAWQAPTLAGSWANAGGTYAPAGYYRDGQSVVRLRGAVAGGSGTIFTLPYGCRPAYKHIAPSLANGVLCQIEVGTDGTVAWVSGGTNAWVSLDNISFRVG